MLKLSLCDYSDAFLLVNEEKKTTTGAEGAGDELARQAAFIEQLCQFERLSIELKKVNLDLTFC